MTGSRSTAVSSRTCPRWRNASADRDSREWAARSSRADDRRPFVWRDGDDPPLRAPAPPTQSWGEAGRARAKRAPPVGRGARPPSEASPWLHPDRAVEPNRPPVEDLVLEDVQGEGGVLVGPAEALGERHLLGERYTHGVRERAEQRRLEDARRDRHHADAELGEIARDRQRHAHDAALRCGVGGLPDLAIECGDRRRVDDHAALAGRARRLFSHLAGDEADTVERPDQVDLDDTREL